MPWTIGAIEYTALARYGQQRSVSETMPRNVLGLWRLYNTDKSHITALEPERIQRESL